MKRSFANFARHLFRSYRNGPIRIGHSFIRRSLDPMLDRHQEIQLRSGLKLSLDLSKGNQNAIFWNDNDGGLHLNWAIRELVPPNGVFLDCGANCGLVGLLAHQYRFAKVIFIEPHPRLAKSISDNIRLNNFESSCELIEAAASDVSGEIPFYENLRDDGSHSIRADLGAKMQLLGTVRSLTLREIIDARGLQTIHFLKIDTEGNDHNVLKGLGQFLQPSQVEIVFVEMLQNQKIISDYMLAKGYAGFVCSHFNRSEILRIRHIYGSGGSVSVFEPLKESFIPNGDVLWCGKDSYQAAFLNRLNAGRRK